MTGIVRLTQLVQAHRTLAEENLEGSQTAQVARLCAIGQHLVDQWLKLHLEPLEGSEEPAIMAESWEG